MTTLDLATVILLHKTSLLTGASALLLLWWRADRPPGVLAIAVAFLLLALGSLLAGLGQVGAVSPHVWQDTSIAIAVGAYGQLYLGVRSLDRPVRRMRRIHLATAAVLAVGLATPLFQDNGVRATTFHAVGAVACAAAALSLWRHARAEPLPSRLPLATTLTVSAVVYALQLPLLLSGLATSGSIALGFAATMMLNFVVAALVVSMVRERREEVQRRVSITDALTGVLNRHGFLSHVPDRIDPPGALILFDLDHFKRINDRFGHAAGDLALQGFARLVRGHLGAGDVVARLGGEEFVVFLENGAGGRAARLAEDIRLALVASPIPWGHEAIALTTSIGVAEAQGRPDRSRDRLLAAADTALYQAKGRGRDRVEVARPNDGAPSAVMNRLDRRVSRAAG